MTTEGTYCRVLPNLTYIWDFCYDEGTGFKPSIIFDKSGKQIKSFNTGFHQIAVNVVDNDGLEGLNVLKLKINGVVSY